MYYVYVIQSKKEHSIYVGFSADLKSRIISHQKGQNQSTKRMLPISLIFYECYLSESDAKRREQYFKTTKGKTTLRAMLRDYFKKQN